MPRFRYSLRTLFVVVTLAAVACWYVGSEYRFVQARQQFLQQLSGNKSWVRVPARESNSSIPWIQTTLGDEPVQNLISFYWPDDVEMERVQTLFPEAELYRMTPYPQRDICRWLPPEKN